MGYSITEINEANGHEKVTKEDIEYIFHSHSLACATYHPCIPNSYKGVNVSISATFLKV